MLKIRGSLARLRTFIEHAGYRGYDPYDALRSPLLRTLCQDGRWRRIVATQIVRRLPYNLRPLLQIRPGYNAKGLGLFLWGYARLAAMGANESAARRVDELLALLDQTRSNGYAGNSWGYNFDWQSRAFFLPRGTPTVVNTAFVGHALLDAYELLGDERALALALPIADFILRDLNRLDSTDGFCFSYSPLDTYAVHNANLLAASILARLTAFRPDDEMRDCAGQSMAYSIAHQHADGSWWYAERESSRWIDSFHTGFNLQCLRYLERAGFEGAAGALEPGARYYRRSFFLADGTPKYYHDRTFPIDIHAPAQAIAFFSGEEGQAVAFADHLASWAIDHLQDDRGYFYFRRGRFFVNRIPYMRWGQAWAFHALTALLYAHHTEGG